MPPGDDDRPIDGVRTTSSVQELPSDDPERHTRTDALRASLKLSSVRAGYVTTVAQAAQVGVGVVSLMILARLLTPFDFGVFAMAMSLFALVSSFGDFGFPAAVVHRNDLSHRDVSSLFWLNLKLNVVLVVAVAAVAPAVAWFYGESQLTAVILVMAAGLFLTGLAQQHRSLLRRQMRFAALSWIEISSLVIGVLGAIGAALLGAGYWALAVQYLVTAATRTAGAWLACDWRPGRERDVAAGAREALASMTSYGSYLSAYRLVMHAGKNLDAVLIGFFVGASPLGIYNLAFRWAAMPYTQLNHALMNVAVSGMSRVQDSRRAFRSYTRMAMLPMFALPMPALAFMAVEAESVIMVALGSQWNEAIPIFRILCISALIGNMGLVTRWLYLAEGETRRQFRWGLISAPIYMIAVAIGVRWGIHGVAVAYAIANLLLSYPRIAYCLQSSRFTMEDFISVTWRPLAASIGAVAILLGARALIPTMGSAFLDLPLRAAFFGLGYLFFWLALPGGVAVTRLLLEEIGVLRARRETPATAR